MTTCRTAPPEAGTSLGELCAHLCPLHPWMVGQSCWCAWLRQELYSSDHLPHRPTQKPVLL